MTVRMVDADEHSLDVYYEVAETLSGALPIELIPDALGAILAELQVSAGDYDLSKCPVYVWISAAGFTPWTRDDYLVAMEQLVPNLVGGSIQYASAANDGVSLLLGSGADGIVIAGTGSTVITQGTDRVLSQSGGHEWVACDDGSGFWIGMRAIRKAYRDKEAEDNTALLQRLRQCYSIRATDDRALIEKLRELAIGSKDMKKEIARFAADVCVAAQRGDKEAQNIVKLEAEALADVTAERLRRTFDPDALAAGVRVVQCGSVLANEFYRATFENQVEMRLRSDDHKAVINWERVTTGGEAAVELARELEESPARLESLSREFRPAIVRRR